jgi:hypothetical protein
MAASSCRTKVKYGQYETTLVPDPTGAQIQVQHTDVFGPGHITFYPPGRVAYTNTKPDVSPPRLHGAAAYENGASRRRVRTHSVPRLSIVLRNLDFTRLQGTYSSFSIWCTPSAPGASRILAFITTDRSFTGVKGLIFGAIMVRN